MMTMMIRSDHGTQLDHSILWGWSWKMFREKTVLIILTFELDIFVIEFVELHLS